MAGRLRQSCVGLLVAAALASACAPATPSPSGSIGTTVVDAGGLVLEYPANWTRFQYEMTTSFSSLIGYLATVPVRDPCTRTANSVSCTNEPYELAPHTLVVEIMLTGGPRGDLDLNTMPLTIGGMPARLETREPGADRLALTWEIAYSPTESYRISADMRGPGLRGLRAQVTSMVEDLTFNPPLARLPDDPADRATGAEAALIAAVAALRQNSPEVACFPLASGATRSAMVLISGTPDMREPVAATCSTRVEASRLELWKVVLTIELEEPTPNLGRSTFTVWLTPDHQVTVTEESREP